MKYLLLFLLATTPLWLHAQNATDSPPIIFIYDSSGSMWGQLDGSTKMEIAADVLNASLQNLPPHQAVGLVAYGHRRESDCSDVETLVDQSNTDPAQIQKALSDIRPLGRTPLARSAVMVLDSLRASNMSATVILLTDGIESCGGDLCEVVKSAKEDGIDFRLHVIGFGIQNEETLPLRCAAGEGDGRYFDAASADELAGVLNEAMEATVDSPADNLTLFSVKNGTPIDALVVAYRAGTTIEEDQARTYADTSSLYLPSGSYDIEVTPLEGSDVGSVKLYDVDVSDQEKLHKTVSFDSGELQVLAMNNSNGWDSVIEVKNFDGVTVASGRTYGEEIQFDLNPGSYVVHFQALKLEGDGFKHQIRDVTIDAGETAQVQHNFRSGTARIGTESSGELIDCVVSIFSQPDDSRVAGGRTYASAESNPKSFLLTPGKYRAEIQCLGDYSGQKQSEIFEITGDEIVKRMLQF